MFSDSGKTILHDIKDLQRNEILLQGSIGYSYFAAAVQTNLAASENITPKPAPVFMARANAKSVFTENDNRPGLVKVEGSNPETFHLCKKSRIEIAPMPSCLAMRKS